jgi:hypothetical protein
MADAVALNLGFLGTVALGLLMFLAGFALFIVVLLASGAGRLAALLLSGPAAGYATVPARRGARRSRTPGQERGPAPHP